MELIKWAKAYPSQKLSRRNFDLAFDFKVISEIIGFYGLSNQNEVLVMTQQVVNIFYPMLIK